MMLKSFISLACAGLSLFAPGQVPADYAGKPLSGTPQLLPGTIQAESYDVAEGDPKGVTVNYKGTLRKSDIRPGADSAGLAKYGNGHVRITGEAESPDQAYAGWTETGEWMAYTVVVKEAGTYQIGVKFAAGGTGSQISFSFGPDLATGPIELPTTAGYQPNVEVYHVWNQLDNVKEITLPAGTYVMKMKIEKASGLNLDYFVFSRKG